MLYVTDTVALLGHLEKRRKLGRQAQKILDEADQGRHTIALSGVTLMEVLYLSERGRISVGLGTLGDWLVQSRNYIVVPVDFDIIVATATIDDIPELHDRVIVGTAVWLGVAILTKDSDMAASRHVRTIWQ